MIKNSPDTATGAHVSLIGHITPDELKRHISSIEMTNGYANRILWVCVRSSKDIARAKKYRINFDFYRKRFLNTITILDERGGVIELSEEALNLWDEGGIYSDLKNKKRDGVLKEILARASDNVLRLACIYTALDGAKVCSPKHLKAALEIWRYCEESAAWIFGEYSGNQMADTILAALEDRPEGMSRTDIRNLFNRNKSLTEIETALEYLFDRGFAYQEKFPPRGGKKGKWVERWFASSE